MSLKYIGRYIGEAGTLKWGKLSYRHKMLSAGFLRLCISRSCLLAKSIDLSAVIWFQFQFIIGARNCYRKPTKENHSDTVYSQLKESLYYRWLGLLCYWGPNCSTCLSEYEVFKDKNHNLVSYFSAAGWVLVQASHLTEAKINLLTGGVGGSAHVDSLTEAK